MVVGMMIGGGEMLMLEPAGWAMEQVMQEG
jgi:hypothetical protein